MTEQHDIHHPSNEDSAIAELANIEELVRKGHPIPHARKYKFRIDKGHFETAEPVLSCRQILAFAGKTPEEFKLYEHKPGQQPVEVKVDDSVDLRNRGVERFTTMPRDTTEGRGSNRQDFQLPSDERSYLDSLALPWETITCSGQWLIIHGWKIPGGFTAEQVSLAILIPPGYPDTQLDMVYVSPRLSRRDGRAINATSDMNVCGGTWQRWSRHRTPKNPWRSGVDDIASHLSLVDSWFQAEQ